MVMPEIRPAIPDDASAIAAVHVFSWRAAYRDILPADLVESRTVELCTEMWQRVLNIPPDEGAVWVAVDDGETVGFASVFHSRDPDGGPETGEVPSIYLAPSHYSTGVGRELFATAVD